MFSRLLSLAAAMSLLTLALHADGVADNLVEQVRRVPPPGVAIPKQDRDDLEKGVAALSRELATLPVDLKSNPDLLRLLPDVAIFHKAVDWALRYDEFFNTNQVKTARELLRVANERLGQLRDGHAPWLTATGLVVRAYVSKIDGSLQPYGLVVPASYRPGGKPMRLDFWFHGRGETLSELDFLAQRLHSLGDFTPSDAIVLHTYGRYCNGQRFAGEVDAFEALAAVERDIAVDPNRIAVRGFSLGGAACWHFTTLHAGLWAAAAPGAGFSETADFLKVFQQETLQPTRWEQKLWRLYDSTEHAANLFNVPTVAYSGEIDHQKQAADMMVQAAAAEGLSFKYVIGKGMAHRYDAASKQEISAFIDEAMVKGRDPVPAKVRFVTHSLRYNEMKWVRIDGLGEHWEPARVEAEIAEANRIVVTTTNVTGLTLQFPAGQTRLARSVDVVIDGSTVAGRKVMADGSLTLSLRRNGSKWNAVESPAAGRVKRHGLQGPIDDAFYDSFLFVTPTGTAANPALAAWADSELQHAMVHWRREFRGEARVKRDVDVTAEDLRDNNVVVWGDPSSNRLLKRLASKLPIQWSGKTIKVGQLGSYPSATHALVGIYPNPLNPDRYVVLNSSFTFREYDYLNNARQTPKLPDWAVIDITQPATSRFPGKVVDAGFFDEQWKLKKAAN
jgi:dienelactone hydrolase